MFAVDDFHSCLRLILSSTVHRERSIEEEEKEEEAVPRRRMQIRGVCPRLGSIDQYLSKF